MPALSHPSNALIVTNCGRFSAAFDGWRRTVLAFPATLPSSLEEPAPRRDESRAAG
jgi:hypothetical protein